MDEKSINQKLNAPKKVSGFEKQRQEAETKRLREEAETRKALREFQDSFAEDDQDDDPISALAGGSGSGAGSAGVSAGAGGSLGGPRHFTQIMRSSGPGTLGPPPSLKRKRELEEERERRERESRGRAKDYNDASRRRHSQSPDSAAAKRPTMLLAQLPKRVKKEHVAQLIPANLKVDDVAFLPPAGPGADKRHLSAIVTVAADTPMSDVDSCVSALQGKYLGFGCYLNISRHITSSATRLGSGLGSHNARSNPDFQPFGAKPFDRDVNQQMHSMRSAPPPESFDSPSYGYQNHHSHQRTRGPPVVTVTPPSDLKLLKAVHKTVEKVIQYGPAFETCLLSSPDVQKDEQWAWIFDATSQSHVYYRWLIYEYHAAKTIHSAKEAGRVNITGAAEDHDWDTSPEGQYAKKNGLIQMFDQGPLWQPPRDRPKFEYVFDFEDLVQDSGYVSSDDDSGDEGANASKPATAQRSLDGSSANSGTANYLNPYRRAKFVHLLARLPDTLGLLRSGDVAQVTSFVVNNAGTGADEIVSMLVENVEMPYSRAVVYDTSLDDLDETDPDDRDAIEKRLKNEEEKKKSDPSNAKLIALYVISDALQASSTSGVRDAWKFRGLFETALRSRKIFEHLGRLEKELNWGRLKAEQWKRKVGVVLGLWEKWSVFSAETQKAFKDAFLNPPLTAGDQAEKDRIEREAREKREDNKWKSGTSTPTVTTLPLAEDAMDVDEQKQSKEEARQSIRPEETDAAKKEDEASKNQGFADRMASLKRNARASRPTAADLLDKQEERPAPPPPPKISVGSFRMSLGSGGLGGVGGAGGVGLSLGKKAEPEDKAEGEKKRRGPAEDMFGDSDGE